MILGVFFGVILVTGFASVSFADEEKHKPPLQQIKDGIKPWHVKCNQGMELIFKTTDYSPACVTASTRVDLVMNRHWGEKWNDQDYLNDVESKITRTGKVIIHDLIPDDIIRSGYQLNMTIQETIYHNFTDDFVIRYWQPIGNPDLENTIDIEVYGDEENNLLNKNDARYKRFSGIVNAPLGIYCQNFNEELSMDRGYMYHLPITENTSDVTIQSNILYPYLQSGALDGLSGKNLKLKISLMPEIEFIFPETLEVLDISHITCIQNYDKLTSLNLYNVTFVPKL